jgi:hypothetical protein
MLRLSCLLGMVLVLVAPVANASYINGSKVMTARAEIDTATTLFVPGTGVHIDVSGPVTFTYTNATLGSVDIALSAMTLTGTIQVLAPANMTGTVTATLFTPGGSPQGPGTNTGQLTPTNSYFNAYTKIVVDFAGSAYDFAAYTGINSSHGGAKGSAFKEETNSDTGKWGVGAYDNTRFPLDFMGNNSGGGNTYLSPIMGSHWTITPEPATLALLGLSLPLLRRRRSA